ncbi:MAG: CRISPR-associated protein Csx20 [Alkaliphilus sp.]
MNIKEDAKQKSMILLLSHELLEEQREDARLEFDIVNFIEMPIEIKKLWGNIPPQIDFLTDYLASVKEYILEVAKANDYILIQGDYGATYHLVRFAFRNNFVPVYVTTERKAVDEVLDNGEIKTERIFKHVKFRKYGE